MNDDLKNMSVENINSTIEQDIFGSFYIGDGEFALPVLHIQEVVNTPERYTSVPLAPNFLKGLFNLRGTVIPVINLRELLNYKIDHSPENQKVAIIDFEGCCIGLLFDSTGEIFRSSEEERSDFNTSNSSNVISGVFKKEGGKRIIQILDVTKLFKLQNIPKDGNRNRLGRESLNKKRGQRKQCISFVVGPAKCALPMSDIREIIKTDNLNESALSVGQCIGTIDLRGTTVPVIDFATLLKYRQSKDEVNNAQDRRIVVMMHDKELFGLMVDSIHSIISYFPDELIQFPLLEQSRANMFLGCISQDNEADVLLLDHHQILTNDEIHEITHGHSRIYQNLVKQNKDSKQKGGARKTYITFSIDNSYAVDINDIKEIIEFPSKLLHPPGLHNYVKGVLNLRGDLVTIVDARSLYAFETKESLNINQKVLVFNKNGFHFGLIVDSVESIVTFAENDKIKLPEVFYKSKSNSMTADVSEAVEITNIHGEKMNMLILCPDLISTRISESIAS